jgi:PAS domain S-box-containing protein
MKRFHSAPLQQQRGQATLSVVLIYGIFAALWILFSDKAVEALFDDPAMIIRASMLKGWLFVAVTTGLLYVLVKRQIAHLNAAHRKEIASLQERQKSLDLLNAIVDNSDDAIFAKDSQGRMLLFNHAACRYAGKSAAEILGRDDCDIFPPEQAEKLMAFDRQVMADGMTRTIEEILDTAIGKRILLATKGPLRDVDQRIIGIFGISRDITERKQAENLISDSEERFRTLASNIPGAVYRCELQAPWRATMMSESVLSLTGHAAQDFLRPDNPVMWGDLVVTENLPQLTQEVGDAIRQQHPYNTAYRIHHADGTIRWVLEHGRAIYAADGVPLYLDGVIFDITARKLAEEELFKRNEELERFNRAMVGRELDMVELKQRINAFSKELGREPPFDLAFLDAASDKDKASHGV